MRAFSLLQFSPLTVSRCRLAHFAPLSGGVSRNRHRETARAIPFHSRMSHQSLTLPLDVIYANDFEAPHHDSTLNSRVRRRGTRPPGGDSRLVTFNHYPVPRDRSTHWSSQREVLAQLIVADS